jgi:hypothetical protein
MVKEAVTIWLEGGKDGKAQVKVINFFKSHPDYYSLIPHLSRNTSISLEPPHALAVGAHLPGAISYMIRDIRAIEREWDLL